MWIILQPFLILGILLMQLSNTETKFYIKLASGQEIGPYDTYGIAAQMASPYIIEGVAPSITQKTLSGQDVLFG